MVCMHAMHGMQVCMHCIHTVCMHACGERWRGAPAAPWRGRWQLCACCQRTRERSGGDATRAQWRRRRGRARRTRCTWRAGGARGGVRVLLGAGHAPGGRSLSLLAAARGCASTLGPRLSAWQEPRAGRCAPSALPGLWPAPEAVGPPPRADSRAPVADCWPRDIARGNRGQLHGCHCLARKRSTRHLDRRKGGYDHGRSRRVPGRTMIAKRLHKSAPVAAVRAGRRRTSQDSDVATTSPNS